MVANHLAQQEKIGKTKAGSLNFCDSERSSNCSCHLGELLQTAAMQLKGHVSLSTVYQSIISDVGLPRPEGGGVLLTRYGKRSWGRLAHQAMAHPCQIVVRNATNVSAHLSRQAMWGSMWRLSRLHSIPRNPQIEKCNQCNVSEQTSHPNSHMKLLPGKHSVVHGINYDNVLVAVPKKNQRPFQKVNHKSQTGRQTTGYQVYRK